MTRACALPADALLRRYEDGRSYVDAYCVEVPTAVTFERYVEAFYTTWLFRLERWILAALVRKPSSDAHAAQLAAGTRDAFAAWTVEARAERQLLMCDFRGQTRSWFTSEALPDGGTRLYFGSAVVPPAGASRIGTGYSALMRFHVLYSHALLRTCARRLLSNRDARAPGAA